MELELQELVLECKLTGIKVIQDQVANHVDIQRPWVEFPN